MERTINPMKRVSVSRRNPPPPVAPEPRDEHHRQPGNPGRHGDGDQRRDRQFHPGVGHGERMTPVMVPGLAAKRISGVSDCFDLESPAAGCPLSMENPIHASTPPPATMKASSDTPKRCSNCVPSRAASVRMTKTAAPALRRRSSSRPTTARRPPAQTSPHRSPD